MTKSHPDLSAVSLGRHLLAFALVAGSLLVAESLAIQSPLHTPASCGYDASARCGRRRSPQWRLGNDNVHSSSPSVLFASSESKQSTGSDAIDAVGSDIDTHIQNVSSQSTTKPHETSALDEDEVVSMWPKMDELDKRMMKIALPCIANFAINPLIGAVDLFWVNRMGNALAVAGQAAANQVFSSAFWIVSVLPSGACGSHSFLFQRFSLSYHIST